MQTIQSGPQWRLRLSTSLLPYGRILAAVALLLMLVPLTDSFMGCGILGLSTRKAGSVSLGIGLLWYIVAAPDLHYLASPKTPRAPTE